VTWDCVDHVVNVLSTCFTQRPCPTTHSSESRSCSTRSRTGGRNTVRHPHRRQSPTGSRTDRAKSLRNTVRHLHRSHLEAQHQRHLTSKDRHPVQVRVSHFIRSPATADSSNLVFPFTPASAPRRVDPGEDLLKGAQTGTSCHTTYLQLLTIGLRYVGYCAV
jgi:hypothetical protein